MADTTKPSSTVSVTIDGRVMSAERGELLIETAERAGTYVPRFCYHPRMAPVGMCRMCLVEVDSPRGATLQPACFISVTDGMVVSTDSEKVKKAQDGVIEFLLANHPLDCPVCDKGGECPLQDQTLTHGSGETRFIEEKRHFAKPVSIGELVLLDRERCIQCARCTRFAAEVAGDAAIDFAGRGDKIEVAPFPSEPFDSVFSGNTVQICPVGALTAKPYRFAARPWDLEQVESTCTTCAVGCRVAVQSSANRLTRLLGIDSDPVNHGWLCDKGRFAIEAVNGADSQSDVLDPATRLSEPLVRRDGEFVSVGWGEALAVTAALLRDATADGPHGIGAIGGAALTNEGAFAWQRLLREVLGTDNLDAQYDDGLDAALIASLPRATIDEMASACTVVLLCGDLREELPVLFLRLRDGVVKGRTNIVELATGSNSLRGLARVSLPTRPGEAHLVARALSINDNSYATLATHPHGAGFSDVDLAEARRLIGESGEGVVFVVGRANLAESASIVEQAIRTFADTFPKAKFMTALRRANVMGALDMGLAPGLLPGRSSAASRARVSGHEVAPSGRGTTAQLRALASGEQSAVILLGGLLTGNVGDHVLAESALSRAHVIAVTGHGGPDLAHADVVLPAVVSHERSGTVTNIEGRVSSVIAKVVAPGSAWNDVAIAAELAETLGLSLGLDSIEATSVAIESTTSYPAAMVLRGGCDDGVVVGRAVTASAMRSLDPMANPGIHSAQMVGLGPRAGSLAQLADASSTAVAVIERQDVASSNISSIALADAYSLRVVATRRLYDRGAAVSGTPALAALSAATTIQANPYDLDRLGVTTGDVVRVVTARGNFELPVTANVGVTRGTAEVFLNTVSADGDDVVGTMILNADDVVVEIRLESR
jgi:NADH-quinone oxidoreductase subunit G